MPIKVEDVFDDPDDPYHPASQSALPYRSYGQSERSLVDVVRLHGLRIGDGCIIRLVLILCFVTLAVKHLKLRKWISRRVIGKLRLLLMVFPTGKIQRESLRSMTPVMYINTLLKSFTFYQEPQEILVKV